MFHTYVQDIIVHQNSYLALLTTHLILVSKPIVNPLSFPCLEKTMIRFL